MSILRRKSVRIALDVTLLIGFLAEFITREGPDYAVHSWIGIVLIPIIAIHLASSWRWVMSAARRRHEHPEWPLARFNAVLMIITTICIVTGFPLWLEWSDAGALSASHTVTGFVSLLMAGSHIWRNRTRIKSLMRRSTTAAA